MDDTGPPCTTVELTDFTTLANEGKQQESDSFRANGSETTKDEKESDVKGGTVKVVDLEREVVEYRANGEEEALDESPLLQVKSGSTAY